ncbi:MAG TPA: hypothetical protein EYQ81_14500 [Sneathiellales bacterium]|nr:hypothetical protein [Sneathiellales bacterium]
METVLYTCNRRQIFRAIGSELITSGQYQQEGPARLLEGRRHCFMSRPAPFLLTLVVLLFCVTKGWSADFETGAEAAQRGDYATALSELNPLAELRHARAQHALGLMYKNGHGVPQDQDMAVKWITNAANQGFSEAQFSLGTMYAERYGVARNYKTAVAWYQPAAEQGDAQAQHILAWLYQQGKGVPQSHEYAVKWFRLAAEQGLGNARFYLFLMDAFGPGIVLDYVFDRIFHNFSISMGNVGIIDNAVYWFTLAAKQGNADAQNSLGTIYQYGRGVTQNYATAQKWYRIAEKQGHSYAQFNLGLMYEHGHGARQNYKTAVKWFRLAAEQGVADAHFHLGVMYSQGTGVKQDFISALMWFKVAASRRQSNGSLARDKIAINMTPTQIAEAQKLANDCVRKNFDKC